MSQSLKDVLERLGLRQAELAKLLDVSPRTVSQWATGDTALPGPVAAYLRVLQMAGPAAVTEELGRLKGRSKMFDEGIYGLTYKGEYLGQHEAGQGLAVLRNGKILGSDRWGGVFAGSYEYDPVNETNRMHVRIEVPPEGTLVTGFSAGTKGATLDIVGAFERAAPVASAVVDVGGRPVEIELTYLGPLPT
ncbi:MAG TPA: helix-turn-helix domain-containing protein [Hyphomicrobiaceae bacterium]|nr:helix-turn-helix domain-containing protein [Hyphomicrobiaceae bacterium]